MRILLIDVETKPHLTYSWSLWDKYIPTERLIEPGGMICYAAKWVGESGIMFDSVHNTKPLQFLKRLHKLLSECDAVVHYNGKKFDIKEINKEFVKAGLKPPPPYKQIDLLSVVKKQFRFPSNKLSYVSEALGIGKKHPHEGFDLWVKCMAGDEKAWKTMEKYNIQDVRLLEKLYKKLLPWINSHPNRNVIEGGEEKCPTCGHNHYQRRGYALTNACRYRRFQCLNCGAWFRSSVNEGPKPSQKMMNIT